MKTYSEKILLIDSNSSNSQLIEKRLSLIGYTVILSNNGKDAFIKFQKEKPALLILDLMLPDIDGYTFCTRIRKESIIPIIIITSLDTITDRIISFNLGVDDFLKKPFYLSELEVRIKAILKRAKICKENYYQDEKDVLNIGKLNLNFRKKKYLIMVNLLDLQKSNLIF